MPDGIKDLWAGQWIVLSRDGEPMYFTMHTVGYDRHVVYDHIGVAADANEVRFFPDEASARYVCDVQWPGWEMTAHRVERLEVLAERFSRGYVG